MFEELKYALRRACRVELLTYRVHSTHMYAFEVKHKGITIWRLLVAENILVNVPTTAFIEEDALKMANGTVDRLLSLTDWSNFYG